MIHPGNRSSRKPSRRLGDLTLEHLELRCMLAVTPLALAAGEVAPTSDLGSDQVEAARMYLAANPETEYLLHNSSSLRLVEVVSDVDHSAVRFQQIKDGLPVHNAIITVMQDANGNFGEIYDHGHEVLPHASWVGPLLNADRLEANALAGIDAIPVGSTSEMTWFSTGVEARLSWHFTTTVTDAEVGGALGTYSTIVDALDGEVLSQEKLETDHFAQFETHSEVHPRIVINDAIGAAGSRAYAAPFDAVVKLTLGCTGTLIAPNVVLTARHCGGGAGSTIRFGDNSNSPVYTATVASKILPDGNGSLLDGGDVSIMTLTQNVPTNIATPMRLTDQTDALEGQLAATLGYGYNGVGSQGHGFNGDGWRWGGENIIDVYGSPAAASGTNIISTDFDNGTAGANTISGSDPTPLEFEATTAPGDSGGPVLVQVGGEWVISGVLSGGTTSTSVYGDISWWTGVAPFRAQIEAAGGQFVGDGIGTVKFDKGVYQGNDTITVTVADGNAVEPIEVTLTSDSGDTETITLTAAGGSNYTGVINNSTGGVGVEDGILQAALFDEITVTYNDPDDGEGNPLVANATAVIGNLVAYPSDDIPVNILDNQTITSEIEITDVGNVNDVDVQVNIWHTYTADLDVFLIGPDGTTVELFTDVGGSGNHFTNTVLDDEAATPIASASAPFMGTYRPEGSLADLDAKSITGTWTLQIHDDSSSDQGSLNGWQLFIDVIPGAVPSGDFNGDGNYDCQDIDGLVAEIVAGTHGPSYDLTGDGLVDVADRDAWLAEAGEFNLGPGMSYLPGDMNLDGQVDGADFLVWNASKFSPATGWCSGDVNADGQVDGGDFLVWNANKFQSSDQVVLAPNLTPMAPVGLRPHAVAAGELAEQGLTTTTSVAALPVQAWSPVTAADRVFASLHSQDDADDLEWLAEEEGGIQATAWS